MNLEPASRRLRSSRRLDADGILFDADLPLLPPASRVSLPRPGDVLLRALALMLIAAEATGLGDVLVDRLIDEYRPPFSPAEWTFFEDADRHPADTLDFGWRFEAAVPLFWALGFTERLSAPVGQMAPFALMKQTVSRSRAELLAKAEFRPLEQILDEADLHFCCRHHVRTQPPPHGGLDRGVVLERARAFAWLIGGADWDEVVEAV